MNEHTANERMSESLGSVLIRHSRELAAAGRAKKVDYLDGALDALEDYGWIRQETQTGPKGGRPSKTIWLHPCLGTQPFPEPLSASPPQRSENLKQQVPEPEAAKIFPPLAVDSLASTDIEIPWSMDV